jgi:hypothetical protein
MVRSIFLRSTFLSIVLSSSDSAHQALIGCVCIVHQEKDEQHPDKWNDAHGDDDDVKGM